ncbi:keratin-associated protein 5-2 [Eurytemora carolleeae]|uniref:keratin-associated protein 5-2 n=1 Tax=Eurytemora carolleeae TaxID=1294199 RepID=UPI000C794598|nr:keratin-associated protein 5-2 [Eurytemora carolleeae]|eukprot:XP_023347515.1 keratin-associated protein 5-2-like [Eurytemora affinis]
MKYVLALFVLSCMCTVYTSAQTQSSQILLSRPTRAACNSKECRECKGSCDGCNMCPLCALCGGNTLPPCDNCNFCQGAGGAGISNCKKKCQDGKKTPTCTDCIKNC